MSVALSRSPSPRRGRKVSSDGSERCGDRPGAQLLVALRVEQVLVERARLEDLALLGGGRLEQPRVDLGQRVLHRLPAGARPLQQRGELEQLHVADHRVRDVEVGVEAQLAEPPADLGDRGQQLVAQQPERRLERLGGPEQLLLLVLPLAADRRARLLGERRGRLGGAALRALGVGEHEPLAGARHRDVHEPPHPGDVEALGVGRERLLEQRVRDRLQRAPARAGHARGHQAEHVHVVELEPLGGVHGHHLHAGGPVAARPPPPRAGRRRRRRRSSGRTRARWPGASGARSPSPARRTWRGCAGARRPRSRPRTAAAGAGRAAPRAGGRRGPAGSSRSPPRPRGRARGSS